MASGRRQTILVVEDDEGLRRFYRNALGFAGYSVTAVEDGVEALRYLEADVPDLIILDMALPRLGGRDVQQELVAHAETRHVPTLVITGTDTRELNPAEFTCVRQKPLTADALLEAVEACLVAARSMQSPPPSGGRRERRTGLRCPTCGLTTITRETSVRGSSVALMWRCGSCDAVWPERRKAS